MKEQIEALEICKECGLPASSCEYCLKYVGKIGFNTYNNPKAYRENHFKCGEKIRRIRLKNQLN